MDPLAQSQIPTCYEEALEVLRGLCNYEIQNQHEINQLKDQIKTMQHMNQTQMADLLTAETLKVKLKMRKAQIDAESKSNKEKLEQVSTENTAKEQQLQETEKKRDELLSIVLQDDLKSIQELADVRKFNAKVYLEKEKIKFEDLMKEHNKLQSLLEKKKDMSANIEVNTDVNVENLIDPEVLKKFENTNYELQTMRRRADNAAFSRQIEFVLTNSRRKK